MVYLVRVQLLGRRRRRRGRLRVLTTMRSAVLLLVAVALAVGMASAAPAARAADGLQFVDWIDGDAGAATGTLHGAGVSIVGPLGPSPSASAFDASFPLFESDAFTPPFAMSDEVYVLGTNTGNAYTVAFASPVQDPVLDFESLGSTITFPAGTAVTKISGDATLTVSGSSVSGVGSPRTPSGATDSNGTVRLSGVFSSLTFTATFTFVQPSVSDGIYLQIGGSVPPAPPLPSPPPLATAIVSGSAALTGGSPNVITADLAGPAKELDWDVNGDGVTDASCPGDQPTLQFRPPNRPSTTRAALGQMVSLKAIAPSGAVSTVSKQFDYVPAKPVNGLPPDRVKVIDRATLKNPTYFCAQNPFANQSGSELGPNTNGIFEVARLEHLKCLQLTVLAVSLRIRGCFQPVSGAIAMPLVEQTTVARMITERFGAPADAAEKLLDGVFTTSGVIVNGVTITPASGAAVVVNKALNSILSSDARFSVGNIALDTTRAFNFDTSGARRIVVGTFPRLPGVLDGLAGFAVAGNVSVTLDGGSGPDAHAEVATWLVLPSWLGGGPAPVTARVGADGRFALNGLKIGPMSFDIAEALKVSDLQITYEDGVWQGQLQLCVVGAKLCIRAEPDPLRDPQGGVTIGPGDAFRVYANVEFGPPGVALGTDVYLNSIGAGLTSPPLRFLGGAHITAASIYELEGRISFAFATPDHPYTLEQDRNTLGNDLPPAAYPKVRTAFTLAATADGFLTVPVIGTRVKLGNGYFVYEAPDLVSFGGGLEADFLGVIRMTGITSGDFNLGNRKFNLHGHVDSCLADIPILGKLCTGSVADVSDIGAGGCIEVGPLSVGGGVRFPSDIFLWPLDGCRWSTFADFDVAARAAGAARAAQAGGPVVVHTAAGDRSRVVELRGADGAPRVRVTAADGHTLDSSDGPGLTQTAGIRILRSESLKLTAIGLIDPKPGDSTIAQLPGSPAVTRVREATDQPKAQITATLSGRGPQRTLTYAIGKRQNQRVSFYDAGSSASRKLGTATAGRGQLTFTPIPGSGARRIEARFELAGIPAERITVARFTPPSPRLPRTTRVRVRRIGTTLRVTWQRVAQASRYEVVASLALGGQHRVVTTGRSVRLRGIVRWSAGRVAVRALAPMRSGARGGARFRAGGPRPKTRLRALRESSRPGNKPTPRHRRKPSKARVVVVVGVPRVR
jgi:hypothetical protein